MPLDNTSDGFDDTRFDDSDFEWSMDDEDFRADGGEAKERRESSDIDESLKEIVGSLGTIDEKSSRNERKSSRNDEKNEKSKKSREQNEKNREKSSKDAKKSPEKPARSTRSTKPTKTTPTITEDPPKPIKRERPDDDNEPSTSQPPPIKKAKSSNSTYIRYLKHSQVTQQMIDSGLKFIVISGVEYKIPKPKKTTTTTTKTTTNIQVDLDKLEKLIARDPNRRAHPSLDPEGEATIRRFMDIKCRICSTTFESFFRLKKHFKQLHPGDTAYLSCCDKKFTRRFELLDHIESHDTTITHRCDDCGKTYKTRNCLRTHRKHQHEQPWAGEMCAICGRMCANPGALRTHMLTHISSDRVFECYKCKSGRAYKNEQLLRKHMTTRHNCVRPDNMTVCHMCSSTFRESHLATHMKTVHCDEDREKVQCGVCGFWLLQKTLKTHMAKHNDQGVTCGECGKFLKSKYSLKGHMRQAHSDEFRFRCRFCEKGFHKEKKMVEHVAVKHTRDYPFKCRVLTCGKGFRAEGNWRIHEKKQHPEEYEAFFKPFYKRGPNELVGDGY
jgi:hypothetical protein